MHSWMQTTRDATITQQQHRPLAQIVIAEPELETPWLDDLRKASFTPTLHSNNFDACQTAIERQDVHLVLMSLRSPMMDGIPASRLLRQSRAESEVAIVLLWNSKSLDETLITEALAAGVTDIIRPPFSTDDLIARLNAALKRTSPSVNAKSNERVSKVADTVREGSRLESEVRQALAAIRENSATSHMERVDQAEEFDDSIPTAHVEATASATHRRVDDTVRQGSPLESEVRQALAAIRERSYEKEESTTGARTESVAQHQRFDGPPQTTPVKPVAATPVSATGSDVSGTEWLLSHDLPHGFRAPRFDSSRLKFVSPVTDRERTSAQGQSSQSEVLLDRVWLCPQCHAMPSFRPACPCCGSARVDRDSLMHHFACAYVGQVSEFRITTDGGLSCPKCCAQRLIVGTDCESLHGPHRCDDCNWSPQELEIIGHCLKCGLRFPAHQAHLEDLMAHHSDEPVHAPHLVTGRGSVKVPMMDAATKSAEA